MDVVEYGDCEVRGKRGRRGRERVKGERWRECDYSKGVQYIHMYRLVKKSLLIY